jgi:ankyrin repeat protein
MALTFSDEFLSGEKQEPIIVYSPEIHESMPSFLSNEAVFKIFKKQFEDEIDRVLQFAKEHLKPKTDESDAPGPSSSELETVTTNLAQFKENLFGPADYDGQHKDLLYSTGKTRFFAFSELLCDEGLPLEKRLDALRNLANEITGSSQTAVETLQAAIDALDVPKLVYSTEKYTKLESFLEHPDFTDFRKEFEDEIDWLIQFAEDHARKEGDPNDAPRLTHEAIGKICTDLNTFKDRLFDSTFFLAKDKEVLYSGGKKMLFAYGRLLRSGKAPLERCLPSLQNVAEKMAVCSGGMMTELHDETDNLKVFIQPFDDKVRNLIQTFARQRILGFVLNRHGDDRGMEVHYVNRYFNHLARRIGCAPREHDRFIDDLRGVDDKLLEECEEIVLAEIQPARLALNAAEQYLVIMTGAVRHLASPGENIPMDQMATVRDILEGQEKDQQGVYGEINPNSLLVSFDEVDYQMARKPTLIALEMLEHMRKLGMLAGDEQKILVSAPEGDGKRELMTWDRRVFWIKETFVETIKLKKLPVDGKDEYEEKETGALITPYLLRAEDLSLFSPEAVRASLAVADEQEVDDVLRNFVYEAIAGLTFSEAAAAIPDEWLRYAPLAQMLETLQETDQEEWNVFLHRALAHGANIEAKNQQGQTPLAAAARRGFLNSATALLHAGANPRAKEGERNNIMSLAIENAGKDHTLEQWAAFVRQMIDKGWDIDEKDRRGHTALFHATLLKRFGAFTALADARAGLKAKDLDDEDALLLALREGFKGMYNRAELLPRVAEFLVRAREGSLISESAIDELARKLLDRDWEINDARGLEARNKLLEKFLEKGWAPQEAYMDYVERLAPNHRRKAVDKGGAAAIEADNKLHLWARQQDLLDNAALQQILATPNFHGLEIEPGSPQEAVARAQGKAVLAAYAQGWLRRKDLENLEPAPGWLKVNLPEEWRQAEEQRLTWGDYVETLPAQGEIARELGLLPIAAGEGGNVTLTNDCGLNVLYRVDLRLLQSWSDPAKRKEALIQLREELNNAIAALTQDGDMPGDRASYHLTADRITADLLAKLFEIRGIDESLVTAARHGLSDQSPPVEAFDDEVRNQLSTSHDEGISFALLTGDQPLNIGAYVVPPGHFVTLAPARRPATGGDQAPSGDPDDQLWILSDSLHPGSEVLVTTRHIKDGLPYRSGDLHRSYDLISARRASVRQTHFESLVPDLGGRIMRHAPGQKAPTFSDAFLSGGERNADAKPPLDGKVRNLIQTVARQKIAEFVRSHQLHGYSEEIFAKVEAHYFNHVARRIGCVAREQDRLPEGYVYYGDLKACEETVFQKVQPVRLALNAAEQYLDIMTGAVRHLASPGESIPMDQRAAVRDILEGMQKDQEDVYGKINPDSVLVSVDAENYQLATKPTLIAMDMLQNMEQCGLLVGSKQTMLASKVPEDRGKLDLMERDRRFFWVREWADTENSEAFLLRLEDLRFFSPEEIAASLAAAGERDVEKVLRDIVVEAMVGRPAMREAAALPDEWLRYAPLAQMLETLQETDQEEWIAFLDRALAQGANIEAKNQQGQTPLLAAAKRGFLNAVTALLDAGANPRVEDSERNNVMSLAIKNARNDQSVEQWGAFIQRLMDRGVNIEERNVKDQTGLLAAAEAGLLNVVTAFLKVGADWRAKCYGDDVITLAIKEMHNDQTVEQWAAFIRQMIDKGWDIEEKDREQRTPLLRMAYLGRVNAFTVLADAGADLKATDVQGANALELAACYSNDDVGAAFIERVRSDGPLTKEKALLLDPPQTYIGQGVQDHALVKNCSKTVEEYSKFFFEAVEQNLKSPAEFKKAFENKEAFKNKLSVYSVALKNGSVEALRLHAQFLRKARELSLISKSAINAIVQHIRKERAGAVKSNRSRAIKAADEFLESLGKKRGSQRETFRKIPLPKGVKGFARRLGFGRKREAQRQTPQPSVEDIGASLRERAHDRPRPEPQERGDADSQHQDNRQPLSPEEPIEGALPPPPGEAVAPLRKEEMERNQKRDEDEDIQHRNDREPPSVEEPVGRPLLRLPAQGEIARAMEAHNLLPFTIEAGARRQVTLTSDCGLHVLFRVDARLLQAYGNRDNGPAGRKAWEDALEQLQKNLKQAIEEDIAPGDQAAPVTAEGITGNRLAKLFHIRDIDKTPFGAFRYELPDAPGPFEEFDDEVRRQLRRGHEEETSFALLVGDLAGNRIDIGGYPVGQGHFVTLIPIGGPAAGLDQAPADRLWILSDSLHPGGEILVTTQQIEDALPYQAQDINRSYDLISARNASVRQTHFERLVPGLRERIMERGAETEPEIDLRKTGGFNKYFHTQRQRLRRAAGIILPNLLSPPKGVWNALKARSMLKALKASMVETGNTLAKAPNLIAPKHDDGRVQRTKSFTALTEEILSYEHRVRDEDIQDQDSREPSSPEESIADESAVEQPIVERHFPIPRQGSIADEMKRLGLLTFTMNAKKLTAGDVENVLVSGTAEDVARVELIQCGGFFWVREWADKTNHSLAFLRPKHLKCLSAETVQRTLVDAGNDAAGVMKTILREAIAGATVEEMLDLHGAWLRQMPLAELLQAVQRDDPKREATADQWIEFLNRAISTGIDKEEVNAQGQTALLAAADRGLESAFTALADTGANLQAKNHDGENALLLCLKHGRDDMAMAFIAKVYVDALRLNQRASGKRLSQTPKSENPHLDRPISRQYGPTQNLSFLLTDVYETPPLTEKIVLNAGIRDPRVYAYALRNNCSQALRSLGNMLLEATDDGLLTTRQFRETVTSREVADQAQALIKMSPSTEAQRAALHAYAEALLTGYRNRWLSSKDIEKLGTVKDWLKKVFRSEYEDARKERSKTHRIKETLRGFFTPSGAKQTARSGTSETIADTENSAHEAAAQEAIDANIHETDSEEETVEPPIRQLFNEYAYDFRHQVIDDLSIRRRYFQSNLERIKEELIDPEDDDLRISMPVPGKISEYSEEDVMDLSSQPKVAARIIRSLEMGNRDEALEKIEEISKKYINTMKKRAPYIRELEVVPFPSDITLNLSEYLARNEEWQAHIERIYPGSLDTASDEASPQQLIARLTDDYLKKLGGIPTNVPALPEYLAQNEEWQAHIERAYADSFVDELAQEAEWTNEDLSQAQEALDRYDGNDDYEKAQLETDLAKQEEAAKEKNIRTRVVARLTDDYVEVHRTTPILENIPTLSEYLADQEEWQAHIAETYAELIEWPLEQEFARADGNLQVAQENLNEYHGDDCDMAAQLREEVAAQEEAAKPENIRKRVFARLTENYVIRGAFEADIPHHAAPHPDDILRQINFPSQIADFSRYSPEALRQSIVNSGEEDPTPILKNIVHKAIAGADMEKLLAIPDAWLRYAPLADMLQSMAPVEPKLRADVKQWTAFFKKAIAAGANTEERNEQGRTPLLAAAALRLNNAFTALIDVGANLGAQDRSDQNALLVCLACGRDDMAMTFIKRALAGPVPDDQPIGEKATRFNLASGDQRLTTREQMERLGIEDPRIYHAALCNNCPNATREIGDLLLKATLNEWSVADGNELGKPKKSEVRNDLMSPEKFADILTATDEEGLPGRHHALRNGYSEVIAHHDDLLSKARKHKWLDDVKIKALLESCKAQGMGNLTLTPKQKAALRQHNACLLSFYDDGVLSSEDLAKQEPEQGWIRENFWESFRDDFLAKPTEGIRLLLTDQWEGALSLARSEVPDALLKKTMEKMAPMFDDSERDALERGAYEGLAVDPARRPALIHFKTALLNTYGELLLDRYKYGWISTQELKGLEPSPGWLQKNLEPQYREALLTQALKMPSHTYDYPADLLEHHGAALLECYKNRWLSTDELKKREPAKGWFSQTFGDEYKAERRRRSSTYGAKEKLNKWFTRSSAKRTAKSSSLVTSADITAETGMTSQSQKEGTKKAPARKLFETHTKQFQEKVTADLRSQSPVWSTRQLFDAYAREFQAQIISDLERRIPKFSNHISQIKEEILELDSIPPVPGHLSNEVPNYVMGAASMVVPAIHSLEKGNRDEALFKIDTEFDGAEYPDIFPTLADYLSRQPEWRAHVKQTYPDLFEQKLAAEKASLGRLLRTKVSRSHEIEEVETSAQITAENEDNLERRAIASLTQTYLSKGFFTIQSLELQEENLSPHAESESVATSTVAAVKEKDAVASLFDPEEVASKITRLLQSGNRDGALEEIKRIDDVPYQAALRDRTLFPTLVDYLASQEAWRKHMEETYPHFKDKIEAERKISQLAIEAPDSSASEEEKARYEAAMEFAKEESILKRVIARLTENHISKGSFANEIPDIPAGRRLISPAPSLAPPFVFPKQGDIVAAIGSNFTVEWRDHQNEKHAKTLELGNDCGLQVLFRLDRRLLEAYQNRNDLPDGRHRWVTVLNVLKEEIQQEAKARRDDDDDIALDGISAELLVKLLKRRGIDDEPLTARPPVPGEEDDTENFIQERYREKASIVLTSGDKLIIIGAGENKVVANHFVTLMPVSSPPGDDTDIDRENTEDQEWILLDSLAPDNKIRVTTRDILEGLRDVQRKYQSAYELISARNATVHHQDLEPPLTREISRQIDTTPSDRVTTPIPTGEVLRPGKQAYSSVDGWLVKRPEETVEESEEKSVEEQGDQRVLKTPPNRPEDAKKKAEISASTEKRKSSLAGNDGTKAEINAARDAFGYVKPWKKPLDSLLEARSNNQLTNDELIKRLASLKAKLNKSKPGGVQEATLLEYGKAVLEAYRQGWLTEADRQDLEPAPGWLKENEAALQEAVQEQKGENLVPQIEVRPSTSTQEIGELHLLIEAGLKEFKEDGLKVFKEAGLKVFKEKIKVVLPGPSSPDVSFVDEVLDSLVVGDRDNALKLLKEANPQFSKANREILPTFAAFLCEKEPWRKYVLETYPDAYERRQKQADRALKDIERDVKTVAFGAQVVRPALSAAQEEADPKCVKKSVVADLTDRLIGTTRILKKLGEKDCEILVDINDRRLVKSNEFTLVVPQTSQLKAPPGVAPNLITKMHCLQVELREKKSWKSSLGLKSKPNAGNAKKMFIGVSADELQKLLGKAPESLRPGERIDVRISSRGKGRDGEKYEWTINKPASTSKGKKPMQR